jgi:hypothetical protein
MKKSVTSILKSLEGKNIKEMYMVLKDTMGFDLPIIKKMINLKTGIDIKTFEDLEFKPHTMGDGIMSTGTINNKKYSIISGSMFYSDYEGVNYEVYNEDMDEPDGYLDEEEVTLRLLNLYKG